MFHARFKYRTWMRRNIEWGRSCCSLRFRRQELFPWGTNQNTLWSLEGLPGQMTSLLLVSTLKICSSQVRIKCKKNLHEYQKEKYNYLEFFWTWFLKNNSKKTACYLQIHMRQECEAQHNNQTVAQCFHSKTVDDSIRSKVLCSPSTKTTLEEHNEHQKEMNSIYLPAFTKLLPNYLPQCRLQKKENSFITQLTQYWKKERKLLWQAERSDQRHVALRYPHETPKHQVGSKLD